MHKTPIKVKDIFTDEVLAIGLIMDLYTKDKVEFVKLDNDEVYQLDLIVIEKNNEKILKSS